MKALEIEGVTVTFPTARVPSLKEWVVRALRGRRRVDRFSAVRGVSLWVDRGECVGVIGSNGAGKSTLLRVAAGVIVPSEGYALVRGTVAPLIELGTGFDHELSGRENIYFNGALLGRSERAMREREAEIVAFSGLAEFIEIPLRAYSTGMIARLAFSIATAVDSDVVLLDEILSVGDSAFQQRCVERILGFRDRGCAMLLVSHDASAIAQLSDRVIWLDEGVKRMDGAPRDVIDAYLHHKGHESLRLARTEPVLEG